MRSIFARVNRIKEKAPNFGDYLVLTQAIQGQGFSRDIISRHFNKLIPKNDYDPKDKKSLINQLVQISNTG